MDMELIVLIVVASIAKFKRYYVNRGFEVYITNNILYISWER